jgi:hypothetical protein
VTGSAYFPLVVVFCQRYAKNTGVGTLVSLMLPYSVVFLVAWTTAGFDTERSIDVLVGRKFDDLVGSILILFFAERSKREHKPPPAERPRCSPCRRTRRDWPPSGRSR